MHECSRHKTSKEKRQHRLSRRVYHVRAPYYQPLFLTSHSSCSCWERLLELDLAVGHLFVPTVFALGRPRRRRFAISFCNIYSQVNHRLAVHYPALSSLIHLLCTFPVRVLQALYTGCFIVPVGYFKTLIVGIK